MKHLFIISLIVSVCLFLNTPVKATVNVLMKDGTPIILRLTEEISTRTKNLNDLVHFEVARDVLIDGKVVIKANTSAEGSVNICEKPDIVGQEGTIGVSLISTRAVDNQWVSLRANLTRTGENKQILSAGAAYVCCPVFGLIKGTHAVFSAGSEIKAYTESDLIIKIK